MSPLRNLSKTMSLHGGLRHVHTVFHHYLYFHRLPEDLSLNKDHCCLKGNLWPLLQQFCLPIDGHGIGAALNNACAEALPHENLISQT